MNRPIRQFLVSVQVCAVLFGSALSRPVFGQASGASPTEHRQAASLDTLYRAFFMYQAHLDRVADAEDAQGKDGSGFRNHFQKELGFSDGEFAAVRASAQRLSAKLAAQDAKAKAIVDAYRAKYPRQIQSPSDLPPVPPELLQLQKERDAMIAQEVDALRASLGAQKAARMDAFLQNQFARSVTVQHVGPPPSHDPARNPLPPFPPEVKP